MNEDVRRALRLAAIYLAVGLAWIYFSDAAIERLTDDAGTILRIQTWKGAAFVLVTGLLVFVLSWLALARQSRLIGRLENYAYRHELTGLANRRLAEIRLKRRLERARRRRTGVGLVTLDLDNFGNINDSFGHPVGDELLKAVATRLQESLPDSSILAHPSADEFLLIVDEITGREALESVVHAVRERFSAPFRAAGIDSVYLSASLGAARFPDDTGDADQLMQFAEAALARAKQRGSNAFELFEPGMLERPRRLIELDARLRQALEAGELQMYYQPIIAGDGARVVSFEALMRWHPADGPSIPPTEFIPAAENSGLIVQLGDWAIEQVCRQLASWRRERRPDVSVAVNLSARQCSTGELPGLVRSALKRNDVPPECLILEITESLLMEQGGESRRVLEQLRQLGVGLAIDDFGTGYSSLAYLRNLPVNMLKIDRGFVDSLDRADTDRALIEVILSVARIFGLIVVAEGVETATQLEVLRELGCDRFQGFLFGRPQPPQAAWGER